MRDQVASPDPLLCAKSHLSFNLSRAIVRLFESLTDIDELIIYIHFLCIGGGANVCYFLNNPWV